MIASISRTLPWTAARTHVPLRPAGTAIGRCARRPGPERRFSPHAASRWEGALRAVLGVGVGAQGLGQAAAIPGLAQDAVDVKSWSEVKGLILESYELRKPPQKKRTRKAAPGKRTRR